MPRPKGSKNKPKDVPHGTTEIGNPDFNIKDAKPVDPNWLASGPTPEDMALDRELAEMAAPLQVLDDGPPPMKKIIGAYTLLSEFIPNYRPAKTLMELENQVHQAKMHSADSIETTQEIFNYYCKNGDPNNVGYFHFKDIKVYIEGRFTESSIKREKQTIQQRVFGGNG